MTQSANGAPAAQKKARLKKILVYVAAGVAIVFVGIQFVPVAAKENPPVIADFSDAPEVEAILRRACYDCHSHEVNWRWYAEVAPASWLVGRDVIEGRNALNFSDWPEDEDDRQFAREQCLEQVEEGEMPPWFYTPFHPEAVLTEADMAILKKWGAEKEEEEEEEEEKPDGNEPEGNAAGAGGE
jgi:hypothetical protein